jgi:hypothetical protein
MHLKESTMKKILALATVTAVTAAGAAVATHPDESRQFADRAAATAVRIWQGVEANPVPVILALGTFLLTVVYHTLKGKSFRESVEVAATRVTVVAVPAPAPEPTVVQRAQARTTRTQLIADQIGLENRIRKLPAEVKQAEKDACYTEQSLADAVKALEAKRQAHEEAVVRLEALQRELAAGEAELAAIDAELKKLADVV